MIPLPSILSLSIKQKWKWLNECWKVGFIFCGYNNLCFDFYEKYIETKKSDGLKNTTMQTCWTLTIDGPHKYQFVQVFVNEDTSLKGSDHTITTAKISFYKKINKQIKISLFGTSTCISKIPISLLELKEISNVC